MKTIILIITIFSFQVTTMFSGIPVTNNSVKATDEAVCPECPSLTPVVPMEADFNDTLIPVNINGTSFAPEVPAEADFSDTL
ncbi:MAG: hypothetical protein ABIJ04_12395 [Bacteroidota bacterium]